MNALAWIIHEKWMKDENMLNKKDFGDTTVVAALRRGYRQRLYFEQIAVFRSRKERTFTSSRFSRMPLGLPIRYIPSGMRLAGKSQNLFGIFRETCQVYFLTAPSP